MTLESLWEDFENKVSSSTAESGRQILHDRLQACYLTSETLIVDIQESQTRLQDIEGQQQTFYNLDEDIQTQLHDIESKVTICVICQYLHSYADADLPKYWEDKFCHMSPRLFYFNFPTAVLPLGLCATGVLQPA